MIAPPPFVRGGEPPVAVARFCLRCLYNVYACKMLWVLDGKAITPDEQVDLRGESIRTDVRVCAILSMRRSWVKKLYQDI
jgi:hypothetical protein